MQTIVHCKKCSVFGPTRIMTALYRGDIFTYSLTLDRSDGIPLCRHPVSEASMLQISV